VIAAVAAAFEPDTLARGPGEFAQHLRCDRLAVQLQGGGADRVVLVDPDSGAVAGRITLGR